MSVILDGELNSITANGRVIFSLGTAITIPSGNTTTRPDSPIAGMIRYNTQIGKLEGYNGNTWGNIGI